MCNGLLKVGMLLPCRRFLQERLTGPGITDTADRVLRDRRRCGRPAGTSGCESTLEDRAIESIVRSRFKDERFFLADVTQSSARGYSSHVQSEC